MLCLLFTSCGTPGSIKSPANLSMNKADSNFNPISPIGNKPLGMDTDQLAYWLTFEQPGAPTGYALMINPKFFRGEEVEFKITPKEGVQSKDNSTTTIGSSFYNSYFDLVLRGHRGIIAGDINKAEMTIKKLRESYDDTYGALLLELLIHVSKNDTKKILDKFNEIKRVYPDSALVKSLEGGNAG
jgi:hypothetical protein